VEGILRREKSRREEERWLGRRRRGLVRWRLEEE